MSYKKWISRDEEDLIPGFHFAEEALNYFREKYGKDFEVFDVEQTEEGKVYYCGYVVDREVFDRLQEHMRKQESVLINNGPDEFITCYQPIQIFEDGLVHIVH